MADTREQRASDDFNILEWNVVADEDYPRGEDVEVLLKDGTQLVAHWACDLSGEEQPPFKGCFKDCGSYFGGIETPTHWRPLREGE